MTVGLYVVHKHFGKMAKFLIDQLPILKLATLYNTMVTTTING